MKKRRYFLPLIMVACYLSIICCEDFVDVDTPNYQVVSENVFADDETATAAIIGIYNQLYNGTTYFSNGWQNSVTVLAGMSADLIRPRSNNHSKYNGFWENEISTLTEGANTDSEANLSVWSSAYNIIYLTNSILDGLENSTDITENKRNNLKGQALFIRAFTYFYLTNLYGDVPLLLTPDYNNNSRAPRNPSVDIWAQITLDLDEAIALLEGSVSYPGGERTQVTQYVAKALLARVHLYRENWAQAEALSNAIIAQTDTYEMLSDLDQVFLANSEEAIWQISPSGRGNVLTHTNEGSIFIMHPLLPTFTQIILSDDFVSSIENGDKRLVHWIGYNPDVENYFIQKYKVMTSTDQDISEYSMVLRLAEQYLIRAEAQAMQGNLSGAIADLDKIRERAGLEPLAATDREIDQQTLLDMIMEERKRELFAEWGHRWLDLKRTGRAPTTLAPIKRLWQESDILYPIPEQERSKNQNLSQNEGY